MSRDQSGSRSTGRRSGRARWLYVVTGVAALVLGVAEITVGLIPFALDQTVVYVVSGLALLLAYRVARARWREKSVEADTPDPELVAGTPTPGENLRDALASVPAVRQSRYRPLLREALSDTVVGALVRYTNVDEATARERVRDGTWTDDGALAEFLRGGDVLSTIPGSVRRTLYGESRYERNIRRTVDAVGTIAGAGSIPGPDVIGSLRQRIRSIRSGNVNSETGEDSELSGAPTVPPDASASEDRPTRRWRGVGAIALLCVAVGVLYQRPGVVLAGVAAVGFVAYGRTGRAPEPDLSVERSVDSKRPDPGEAVEVTVRVRNDGAASIADLRLVDGVPAALGVTDGSPRHGTSLRPGGTATFTYSIEARRGVHEFGPTLAICRDLAGTAERTAVVETSSDADRRERVEESTTVVCRPRFRETVGPVPMRQHTTLAGGQVATATGGSGVEFHATREYRPGDPLNRVDWNRRARTGEFATLEFREERTATVVLVVDARDPAYCSPGTGGSWSGDHAVDRSVDAAGRMGARLLADGHRVGLATFGPRDCWLAPGSGREHADRFRDLLATDDALASVPGDVVDSGEWRRRLRQRLPGDAQLLVCTPLVDRDSARLVREFDAYGYPVTTISPDPTVGDTPGHLLARVGRQFRITDLRRAGLPVVDWAWDAPLDATLERYAEVER